MYESGAGLSGWARGILSSHAYADRYELAPELMKKLSSKTDASEIAALIHMRDGAGLTIGGFLRSLGESRNPVYILFDRPSGKGNLGAMMRSCDAFGVRALFGAGHSVDFYDPEVIASSVGSFFAAPFYPMNESGDAELLAAALKELHPGIKIIGTGEKGERRIYDADLAGPLLFLIGNETDGLSWRLSQLAEIMVSVPMSGSAFASSLNVSCAATAILYEAARQRDVLSLQFTPCNITR